MLRWLTAGESHGPQLTVIVEGLPAGLEISEEDLRRDLARRQAGHGRGGRQQIETDVARIVSGVRGGVTIGSPVTLWGEGLSADEVAAAAEFTFVVLASQVADTHAITGVPCGHAGTDGVNDADDLVASLSEIRHRLGADETGRAGDDDDHRNQ